MASWTHFVDMELSDEQQGDLVMPMPMPELPKYPPGLKICLCEVDLEKLDVDDDFEVGDIIDIRALGRVTSASSESLEGGGCRRRVEIQLEQLAVENENDEDEE